MSEQDIKQQAGAPQDAGATEQATTETPGADQQASNQAQQDAGADTQEALQQAQEVDQLPEWAQKIIKESRAEAAKYRNEKKEIEQREKAAREATLAEQGKYKELYESIQPELEQLKAQQEAMERYQTAFSEMLERRLAAVPEHVRTLLADRDPLDALKYIEEHGEAWKAPTAPQLDAGSNGKAKTQSYTGSQEHIEEMAKRFRLRR